jgi:hypothetical protein
VAQEVWSDEALMFFDKCIKESVAIYFHPSHSLRDDEITFGELVIQKPSGEVFELSRKMCEQQMATSKIPHGEKFINVFNCSLSAVIKRWDDNGRNGGVSNCPDTLIVTDIADPPEVEANKLRKLYQSFIDSQTVEDGAKELNKSIEKVTQWFKDNEGIEKENDSCTLPLDGPSSSLESTSSFLGLGPQSIPSTSKSPSFATSSHRYFPSTSKFSKSPSFVTSSPHIEIPIEPKVQRTMKPMSQILKEHRDISMRKNIGSSSTNSVPPFNANSSTIKKVVIVQAGCSTNIKLPHYYGEDVEIVEQGVEAEIELNSLQQMPQGESSDSNNPMAPFITNNSQPPKSDCCIHQ